MDTQNNSKQEQVKQKLLSEYKLKSNEGERVDISKIVNDFQAKFHVPKLMIMKWLNLKVEKSLFVKANDQSDVSVSCDSVNTSFNSKSEKSIDSISIGNVSITDAKGDKRK